ncbi:hypothetical protein RFI_23875 [Reticulomyxa filosa]|uniref:Uncharacterized protein n=1 Tax=Reticulomyxa filosa TaxID=46433 RepID=X6MJ84_RETFI|nr:hypothetical protein RFI_23875 [Reticulomyxa filosa]|eukprot:ETO13492.1 hypothetical protein RFI_23875 [Reticulomyxa filosa]
MKGLRLFRLVTSPLFKKRFPVGSGFSLRLNNLSTNNTVDGTAQATKTSPQLSSTINQSSGEDTNQVSNSSSNASGTTGSAHHPLTWQHMHEVYRKWTRMLAVRVLSLLTCIGIGVYWFWDYIEAYLTQSTANITSRTISDEELQMTAVETSKKLFLQVLQDERVIGTTQQFLLEILKSPQTTQVYFHSTCNLKKKKKKKKKTFYTLQTHHLLHIHIYIHCAQVVDSLKQLVIHVFNDNMVIEQCKYLIGSAIESKENQDKLVNALNNVLNDDSVRKEAVHLSKDTVTNVLNDQDVQKLALFFMMELMHDRNLQQHTSDTLYSIFVGALTPNIFSKSKRQSSASTQSNEAGMDSVAEEVSAVTSNF